MHPMSNQRQPTGQQRHHSRNLTKMKSKLIAIVLLLAGSALANLG
jgi:hypothetical protein